MTFIGLAADLLQRRRLRQALGWNVNEDVRDHPDIVRVGRLF